MSNSNSRSIVAIVAVLVIALIAAWWLLPSVDTSIAEAPPPPPGQAPTAPLELQEVEDQPRGKAEVVIVDDDGSIPRTDKCELIAGWAQRGVPHYTLLDNIRDQAMLFTEDDLACLTAARDVPPIVLRFAEMYQRRDQ